MKSIHLVFTISGLIEGNFTRVLLTEIAKASSPPDIFKSRFYFSYGEKNVFSVPHGEPERKKKALSSLITTCLARTHVCRSGAGEHSEKV